MKPKFNFEAGEMVRIKSGPFQAFTGRVEEVDLARQELEVRVSIFGRDEPLKLRFLDVEKLTFTEENEE